MRKVLVSFANGRTARMAKLEQAVNTAVSRRWRVDLAGITNTPF